MKSKSTLLAALSFTVFTAGLTHGLAPVQEFRESDHKKVGKEVAAYFDAVNERKGIEEAFGRVSSQLDKLGKKLKGKSPLTAVEDMEQIFWHAQKLRVPSERKKGKIETSRETHPNGAKVQITYRVPKAYKGSKGDALPTILVVPDAGQDPAKALEGDWGIAADSAILVAIHMPSSVDLWGTFGNPDKPGGVFTVMNTLGIVQNRFAMDWDGLFLAGSGKGFEAATATAAAFPQFFSGLIGRGNVAASDVTNFRNLPLLLVDGGTDAKAIEASAKEAGFDNCSMVEGEGPMWEWIGATRREAYPAHLTFSPVSPYAKHTNWLQVDGFQVPEDGEGDRPMIDAQVDRESNTITIDAEHISTVKVFLNDFLVDLGKPVKLVINGQVSEELTQRNRREMLSNGALGDWGRVFVTEIDREIPAKKE